MSSRRTAAIADPSNRRAPAEPDATHSPPHGDPTRAAIALRLESHRGELIAHCYRMLGSRFEAEDAVQETLLRAWRAFDRFEGRAELRSWLYRIATNVSLDMLARRERRALPVDLDRAWSVGDAPEEPWRGSSLQATSRMLALGPDGDPAEVTELREAIRVAFMTALRRLPPKQRAVLILCEVLRWKATEVAALLDTSVASVNSALQRARSTLAAGHVDASDPPAGLDDAHKALLARYVDAFERYDLDSLTSVVQEDATWSTTRPEPRVDGAASDRYFLVGPGIARRRRHGRNGGERVRRRRSRSLPSPAPRWPADDVRRGMTRSMNFASLQGLILR